MTYNALIHLMKVCNPNKQTKSKKGNSNTMNITLNKNRKNAAIYIAHKVAKTRKAPTEKDVLEAAERHMTTKNPGPAVVSVILGEVKNLLKNAKNLPPIAPALGEVKPKATPVAKLHKHNDFTTFTSYAKLFDVRGRAEVSTTGIEHAHKFTAADRTKVDCDGLEAVISEEGAAPSMRMWIDA